MKRILQLCITLCVLGGLGLATLMGIAYVYEDDIIAGIRSSIDEHIDTKVSVENISFSLIDHFPQASIRFENAWIEDKLSLGDTLLAAENIYLEFDLFQVLAEDYVVEKADVENGVIHLRTNKAGESNYIFWKENEDTATKVRFEIDALDLHAIDLDYVEESAAVALAARLDDMALTVIIGPEKTAITLDSDQLIHDLTVDGKEYVTERHIGIEGPILISEDGSKVVLDGVDVRTNELSIPVDGSFIREGEDWNIGITASGLADLEDIVGILPEEDQSGISDYMAEGEVRYGLTIEGLSGKEHTPEVRIDFKTAQARIKEKKSGIVLEDIATQGRFSTLKEGGERLEFERFSAELGGSVLSVDGVMDNFEAPWVDANIHFDGQADEVTEFLRVDSLLTVKGGIGLRAQVNGPLPTDASQIKKLNRLKMTGECALDDIAFLFSEGEQRLDGIHGTLVLKDNGLLLDELSGEMNGSPFSMSGKADNFIPYLASDDESLVISARFASPHITLDEWLTDGNEAGGDMEFSLGKSIDFSLALDVQKVTYKEFTAREVRGSCELTNGDFAVAPLSFRSSDGKVIGELGIDALADGRFKAHCRADIDGVDVQRLFIEFSDFGQDFLSSSHLRGTVNADVDYSCIFDKGLEVDMKSITTDSKLRILDGELIEHESMVGIIDALKERNLLKSFVRVDELEEEMHHLHFDELSNSIRIADGRIEIPEMLIASNAMDLKVSGTHTFDNIVDYRFNFRLREILVNRRNSEFAVEDDGLGYRIFLRMVGSVDDFEIEMDKGSARETRKEAIAEAKTDLKEFFKDPFRAEKKEEVKKVSVTIIDEEDEPPTAEKKEEPSVDRKKKKPKIILFEEEDDLDPDEGDDF